MNIYRSAQGHAAISAFCRRQLTAWDTEHATMVLTSRLGDTHVLSAGSGTPLVLVAGTNFSATSWLGLIETLAASYRVHAIDLPGQPGLSHGDRPRRPRVAYGQWLAELLPRITQTPAILVGHSLGAHVLLAGIARGAQAARLVLIDPAGLIRLSVTPRVMKPTLPWLRRPTLETSAALLRMMMAPGGQPGDELTAWMRLVGQHVRTSLAPSPLPSGMLEHARDVPLLVVSGRHDAFVPPNRLAKAVRAKLPHAAVRIADDAGHLLPHERPEAVVDGVRDDLARH